MLYADGEAAVSGTLAVIPARAGSKSIPRKNLAQLCGRPLLAFMIEAALAADTLDDVVVSTEDEEIAGVARSCGAKVPFLRPRDLAGDDVESLPVVQHAVKEMEKLRRGEYEYVVLLQATAPLCRAMDINACLEKLKTGDCDSVVTVTPVSTHPLKMKKIEDGDVLLNYIDQGFEEMRPRQLLPPVYRRSGAVYASKRKVPMEEGTLVGRHARAVVVPQHTAVDIDTPLDLALVELIVSKGYGQTDC